MTFGSKGQKAPVAAAAAAAPEAAAAEAAEPPPPPPPAPTCKSELLILSMSKCNLAYQDVVLGQAAHRNGKMESLTTRSFEAITDPGAHSLTRSKLKVPLLVMYAHK